MVTRVMLTIFFALLFIVSFFRSRATEFTLPLRAPIHCSASAGCSYPNIGFNTTGIVVARRAAGGKITDNLGSTWIEDQCTEYDNGDCIFHAVFTQTTNPGVSLTFSGNDFSDVFLFLYEGQWSFTSGQWGSYASQNSAFPDCVNGQDCPYDWTPPVYAEPGSLLVAWSNPLSSGSGLAKPGAGWYIEASDGQFAVEDMFTPVEAVYSGALIWKMADGSDSGGSHWLMGLAAYKRQ